VVVVDPGPDDEAHVRAVSSAVAGADSVTLLLTHGHLDHAGAARGLAQLTGATVLGAGPVQRVVKDGEAIPTDAGSLVAVETPGHAPEHFCYHWVDRGALFAGDLILGSGDTTWVAGYSGCVGEYLSSIERLRQLKLKRIYPAHGPVIDDVKKCLDRFEGHRRDRIAQVAAVMNEDPEASRHQILHRVYGSKIPSTLVPAALASIDAILDYLGMSMTGDIGSGFKGDA
jgi:glyoxylase-like metal-dependent hydrolase (beta-lactamase superfamily II)